LPEWRNDNLYLRYAMSIPVGEILQAHQEVNNRPRGQLLESHQFKQLLRPGF